jgi:hypothetical protein
MVDPSLTAVQGSPNPKGMRMDYGEADKPDTEVILVGGEIARRRRVASRWGMLLVVFMRSMAVIWTIFGLAHWKTILSGAVPFESLPNQAAAAIAFFAVANLMAAVGLWLAAPWGGALWLATAVGEAIISILMPAYFPRGILTLILYGVMIAVYFGVSWLASQEKD